MTDQSPDKFKYSQSNCPNRTLVKSILEREDEGKGLIGKEFTVAGWIRTTRLQEKDTIAFIMLSDGTCSPSLQVVVRSDVHDLKALTPTGTALAVEGKLIESAGKGQEVELEVSKVLFVSACDPKVYPLSKKGHTLEKLREVCHLRPRTNLFGAVFRVRNGLAFATHKFYQERDFQYVHAPIITTNDAEGAGELFQVTTMLPSSDDVVPLYGATDEDIQKQKDAISAQGSVVGTTKKKEGVTKQEILTEVEKLKAEKEKLKQLEEDKVKVGGLPQTSDKKIDYSKDFFGTSAYMTVSGQLQAEVFACAMSNAYTFGPTFRAEDSHTTRHLAEFWMIEPEIAFGDLQDAMQLAEDYVKYLCKYLLDNHSRDIKTIDAWTEMQKKQKAKQQKGKKKKGDVVKREFTEPALQRIGKVATSSFARVSYTEAVEILIKSGEKFKETPTWGIDLGSEHERYLAEVVYKGPTIIYNYPRDIKAFYMRQNDDGKTVAAMDVVCPQIGELIGGSQREERVEKLQARLAEHHNADDDAASQMETELEWYMELRKYGSVPHSGFGLGFERLVLFATGIENIRDVIPFPRWPGNALC